MPLLIRPETPEDIETIHVLNQKAFAREEEARLVDALREADYVHLSLVAVQDGKLVGHVLFSKLTIHTNSNKLPALCLGPVAVLPEKQHQGIGSALIEAGLEQCGAKGHKIVLVLGDPAYYGRFGFSVQRAEHLDSPYPREAMMALDLEPGVLEGVKGRVHYPPPFAMV